MSHTLNARWFKGAAAAVAVGLLGVAVVRSLSTASPAAVAAERSTPWLQDGRIHYPASFAAREKLTFTEAAETTLTPNLYVTGEVTWDARRIAAIGARIEGRLRSVAKVEGEEVRAGEVVAELESVELGKAQAEVLKVRAREQVASLDAERERKLADAKVSAERDAQFAAATLEALRAERQAAEKAVEALGGTVSGELGVLRLKSPMTGSVVEAKVQRGRTVSSTDTVLVVADLEKVWVELTVFERDLPALRLGDAVDLKLPADPTRVLSGRISHIAEAIDPQRRSAHVRVEMENTERQLRPGLSVTASVHASGPRGVALTVPKSAVTRIDGEPTVFVQAGADAVEPRVVVLGAEDAETVSVTRGLKAGEPVVSHGVLALKAEVFR